MILENLRKAALKSAASITSNNPKLYEERKVKGTQKSPLEGHCAAMAFIIQKNFGGDIVSGKVDGTVHYWNRLPSGKEIDLTSCQFGGDGYTPIKKGKKVKIRKKINPRFILFDKLVRDQLC